MKSSGGHARRYAMLKVVFIALTVLFVGGAMTDEGSLFVGEFSLRFGHGTISHSRWHNKPGYLDDREGHAKAGFEIPVVPWIVPKISDDAWPWLPRTTYFNHPMGGDRQDAHLPAQLDWSHGHGCRDCGVRALAAAADIPQADY